MKIINPKIVDVFYNKSVSMITGEEFEPERMIEMAARTCYQSYGRISENSHLELINHLDGTGHKTPKEFGQFIIKIITDRGVLAEITRHRMNGYCVESTRYVNNSKDIYGQGTGCVFIRPVFADQRCVGSYIEIKSLKELALFEETVHEMYDKKTAAWLLSCAMSEYSYMTMVSKDRLNMPPQEARTALNQSTKTTIHFYANWRQFELMTDLRADSHAHPEIQRVFINAMDVVVNKFGSSFGKYKDLVESRKKDFSDRGWDLCEVGEGKNILTA